MQRVLTIGLDPARIDFSAPDFAAMGLDAGKVLAGLAAASEALRARGCEVENCLTDFGETAEAVVRDSLARTPYDIVVIGAGIRTAAAHFLLFEKLINVVHACAPGARICFNTRPADTAEAVLRWVR
jgi:hypothetical protein